MHTLMFNLKRAHHQTLAFQRKQLDPFADEHITPARFDFLYAIYQHHFHTCCASAVRIALGCVKSNVSRYVKLAVEYGWVEYYWDGSMTLTLTRAAVELIERILRKTNRAVEEHVADCAVTSTDRVVDDRVLRFEHAHDPIDDHPDFRKTSRLLRADMRERICERVPIEILMRALWRVRAVFWDTRLLDVYEPTHGRRARDFTFLMQYRGRCDPTYGLYRLPGARSRLLYGVPEDGRREPTTVVHIIE